MSVMNPTGSLPIAPDRNGQPRVLACLPPKPGFGGLPKFTAGYSLLPRAQWEEVDYTPLGVPVLDQGQHGSCVGHGSTTAFWFAYLMMGGTVPDGGFSPTSLYALVNGGRDAGAVVSDAMDALIGKGVALMADYPESVIYDRQLSGTALAKINAQRLRFRVGEAYHVGSFDEIITALLLGFTVSFGISISNRMMNPGADGVVQPGGFSIGGHCLAGKGVKAIGAKTFAVNTRNSWNKSYGINGDCYLPEGHFGGYSLDAFAIKAARPDPLDPFLPPIAP